MPAKRFRFGLQKILDLRAWEEDKAEHALAAKTGQCAACETALKDLFRRRHETFLGRSGTGVLDLTVLGAHDAFRRRLGAEIEKKEEELARLTVERGELMKVYLEARRRRDVLTKLSEKQAAAFRAAEAKRETLRLDDLNTASFIRKMTLEAPIG